MEIVLIGWGLFKAFYRGKQATRAPIIIVSCLIATGLLIFLYVMGGDKGFVLEPFEVYEIVFGVIAIVIGLLFWGKHKIPPTTESATR